MRVLMISWEFPPYVVGGMGKHVAELVPALADLHTDDNPLYIDVLTTRHSGGKTIEQIGENVTIYRVTVPPVSPFDYYNSIIASNSALVTRARQLNRQYRYDLIHVHEWSAGTAGIALKHEWKTPLVATIHATERGRHQGYLPTETSRQIDRMEWQICYEAWKLIICSRSMHDEVRKFFGVPQDKIEIIPHGLDVRSLHVCTNERKRQLRAQHATNGEMLLFFIGRITHEKGLQVLVRAMAHILQQHPKARLLAAGKNSERMWPLAHKVGVSHAVNFLGYVSDRERDHLYQTVDAAVFPSLYEPFGIVALEAMALNCNIIASDVGGLGEVVHHEENGLTTYPNDAESIAWAVNRLLTDPDAAARRRAAALVDLQTAYNWGKIAMQTLSVYGDIIAERQSAAW